MLPAVGYQQSPRNEAGSEKLRLRLLLTLKASSGGTRLTNRISGVIVPLVTPFREDETLDDDALEGLCEYLITSGVDALFPTGSTGEFFSLRSSERTRVQQIVVRQCRGRVPVVAGVTAISTAMTCRFAREAEDLGVDAIAALTPFYISPNQQELYSHFRAVAEATSLPVLLYNNPARTGVNVAVETVARLGDIPNVFAIKDSSGNLALFNKYLGSSRVDVFQGNDSVIAPSLFCGAAGAVAAIGNIAPALVVNLYRAFIEGDTSACNAAQQKVAELRDALAIGTFPVVIKEAMAMIGFPVGPARRPCAPLAHEAREKLRCRLEAVGLLEAARP